MADVMDNNLMFIEVAEPTAVLEESISTQMQVKEEGVEATSSGTSTQKPPSPSIQPQVKRVRCPECKYYTTENEEKMTRHIRKMHRGENPFQCFMCDYSTYNKVCFEEHIRMHQGIKPYKCSFCSHRTVSKKNMKKHEMVHRPDNPLKCPHCDFFGRHKHALNFHIRECHLDEIDEKATGSSKRCPRCGLKFEDEASWLAHDKIKRKCKKCDYAGCSTALMELHAIKKHGAVKKRKKKDDLFNCAFCSWKSSNVTRVLLHLIHHPKQHVDESVFDLTVLRKYGIVQ